MYYDNNGCGCLILIILFGLAIYAFVPKSFFEDVKDGVVTLPSGRVIDFREKPKPPKPKWVIDTTPYKSEATESLDENRRKVSYLTPRGTTIWISGKVIDSANYNAGISDMVKLSTGDGIWWCRLAKDRDFTFIRQTPIALRGTLIVLRKGTERKYVGHLKDCYVRSVLPSTDLVKYR